jgi:hypothetical protein
MSNRVLGGPSRAEENGMARKARNPSAFAWTTVAVAALLSMLFFVLLFAGRADAQTGATVASQRGKNFSIYIKHFSLSSKDQKQRFTVGCPGRALPLGGGMTADPAPGPDGEGVYPHSYERLGVQHGWHVTAVLYGPGLAAPQPRQITLQVVCAPRVRHVTPPHTTVWVPSGETRTAVATCPGRRQLFAGGFQRTDFTSRGGDYVTESRAINSKSWSVTGHAFGAFGGQLTAIAYCWHSRKPLLTEVTGSALVQPHSYADAFTTACPPGRKMTAGGFSANGSINMFLTDGIIHNPGVWNTGAYNGSGPAATVTAYGYCLRV